MRILLFISAMIAFALTSEASQAQERDEDECLRLQPSITSPVEMAACTSDLRGSEQAVDKAVAELRSRVPAESRRLLDEAQRRWTQHRNAQCRWEAGGAIGSTMNSSDIVGCLADMNRERANYLRDELKRW
jgi:uncharacterized protein YecT (DUF1311 family)